MKTWFGQWGSPLLTTFIILTMAIAFTTALAAIARFAHGAVIDPHVTSPFYITVVAEKGDTAYSIARLFTPRGQSVMPVATAFVAFNNLKYNKKGNPVVHAGRLYAFPTQLSRDRMQALAFSLNTASRDWHSEHHTRMHGTAGTRQMTGANAHHAGPSTLEKMGVGKENGGTGVSDSQTKAERRMNVTSAWVLLVSVLLGMLVWILAESDYREYILKLDATLASSAQSVKEPHGTSAQSPAPDEKKGETSGVSESEVIPQSVAKPEVAPTSEEKPPVQVATGTDTPSPAPDEQKGETTDPRETRAIPLVYQDPQDPYEDPSAPTGLTLGEKFVNVFRAYTMKEVAEALEHDVIPIAALQDMKMTVKHIKLRNIPESVRKHPEWRNQTFHDLITEQEKMLRDIKKETGEEKDTL